MLHRFATHHAQRYAAPLGRQDSRSYRRDHTIRLLACVAVVLTGMIAVVRLWPAPPAVERNVIVYRDAPDAIELEEILQTSQAMSRPPPPPPPVPVESSTDFLLEEPNLDFDVTLPNIADVTRTGPPDESQGEVTSGARVHEAARPVRFVEPEYTQDARRRRLKAEIVVQVLVSRDGRVEGTQIIRRYMLGDSSEDRQAVETVGYGLEEAAIAAARRWVFRPARVDGHPVESFYELTFSFGV